jgi:hypothetical protein
MTPPDATTLNVQPRQRRDVYGWLASSPDGCSVKTLLSERDISEVELRETLRKLDAAGLAKRVKGTWVAVPLDGADDPAE